MRKTWVKSQRGRLGFAQLQGRQKGPLFEEFQQNLVHALGFVVLHPVRRLAKELEVPGSAQGEALLHEVWSGVLVLRAPNELCRHEQTSRIRWNESAHENR